jgi:hypothetical protein
MKRIGQLFYRPIATLAMIVLVLAVGIPYSASANPLALLALQSDYFNSCSYNSTMWSFTNKANIAGASPTIQGAYTGDSYLQMVIPAGVEATFSNTNQNAPRILTSISDADFEVEVKFLGPIASPVNGSWQIEGILVRDNTNPAAPQWLRFDVNSNSAAALNLYMGYIDATGTLNHIVNVTDLPGGNPGNGPVFIRVKYVKATGTWTVTYTIGNTGQYVDTRTFTESSFTPSFTVTDIGMFLGSTGANPPGHTAKIDYFQVLPGTNTDDAIKLTVDKAGTGSGTVNWPMTNPNQCSGNTVTLTATAASDSTFAGWSGDMTSTAKTINVTMNAAKYLVATFNTGSGVVLNNFLYLPGIQK